MGKKSESAKLGVRMGRQLSGCVVCEGHWVGVGMGSMCREYHHCSIHHYRLALWPYLTVFWFVSA